MQKFLENLKQAEKLIQTTDHMMYVTFPLLKDKKIIIKILLNTKIAISKSINSILQYEYLFKKIKLYNNPKTNFQTFKEKSSKRFNISENEIKLIQDLFEITQDYKKSQMEFLKNNHVVILSENMQPKIITIEKTKEFISLSKNIIKKIKSTIER